jgi:AraC-like DNA-binding protein
VTSTPAAAQQLRDLARLRRVGDRIDREYASRQFRRAYGQPPYGYVMTRRIERAMALPGRSDRSVTEACFAVGCSSLGTFSPPHHRAGRDAAQHLPGARRRARRRGCRRGWPNRRPDRSGIEKHRSPSRS